MSEGFDKEAERQKLREKFEAEQSAREQTEQMSELLLKGATMTNKHCGECGDPIFRHDGQEFCPTCERPVETDETAPAEEADESPAELDADEPPETRDTPTPDRPDEADRTPEPPEAPAASADTQPPESPTATDDAVHPRAQPDPEIGVDTPVGDLEEARTALVRTLTTYANRAAASEDPRRARDYLTAAREAAETVAAIDSIGR